jgi:ligand-binding sensor domain-containing protein
MVRIGIAKRIALSLTLSCMLSAWAPCALALDPALEVRQYSHTSWKIRDGFSKGSITSFAQGRDGYLWLGTELGLLRFDGMRAIPWQLPAGVSVPDHRVRALHAARDGTLWIGTWNGLASWNGSRLISYEQFEGQYINGIWNRGGPAGSGMGLRCVQIRTYGASLLDPGWQGGV